MWRRHSLWERLRIKGSYTLSSVKYNDSDLNWYICTLNSTSQCWIRRTSSCTAALPGRVAPSRQFPLSGQTVRCLRQLFLFFVVVFGSLLHHLGLFCHHHQQQQQRCRRNHQQNQYQHRHLRFDRLCLVRCCLAQVTNEGVPRPSTSLLRNSNNLIYYYNNNNPVIKTLWCSQYLHK